MDKSSDCLLLVLLVSLSITLVISESLYVQLNEPEIHHSQTVQPELVRIFENCHINSSTFDPCMKTAFNELRAYFPTGMFKILFLQNYYSHFVNASDETTISHAFHKKMRLKVKIFGAY